MTGHGHLQGDQVLRLAGATLRGTLRASDFAFRIGGDEFALLLPQTDLEQATTLSRRVRAQYENELQPLKLDIAVTLDFGVAVHPQDGDQKSELIKLADKNLYELKTGKPRALARNSNGNASAARSARSIHRQERISDAVRSDGSCASTGTGPLQPRRRLTAEPGPYAVQRKWERVSLAKTKAHAILTDAGQKTAKVIDLSYGGVALEFDATEDSASSIQCRPARADPAARARDLAQSVCPEIRERSFAHRLFLRRVTKHASSADDQSFLPRDQPVGSPVFIKL